MMNPDDTARFPLRISPWGSPCGIQAVPAYLHKRGLAGGPCQNIFDRPETRWMAGLAVTGNVFTICSHNLRGSQRRALCLDGAVRAVTRLMHYADPRRARSTQARVQITGRTQRGGGRAACCHGNGGDHGRLRINGRCASTRAPGSPKGISLSEKQNHFT